MGNYLSVNDADRKIMLEKIGADTIRDLYCDIPDELFLNRELDLPEAAGELAVMRQMKALAAKNTVFPVIFQSR